MHLHYSIAISLLASAASAATLVERQSLAPLTNPSNGWSYSGCYNDRTYSRVLGGPSRKDSSVDEKSCTAWCAGYEFAGVEFGNECYCGHQLASYSVKTPDQECNMPCAKNGSQPCGGSNRVSLFASSLIATTNPGPNGWVSVGCYNDSRFTRTLAQPQVLAVGGQGMTVGQCTTACQQQSYRYAGLEYADECYCGDTIQYSAGPAASGCDMPCYGNSSEFCGGANTINLYQLPSASNSSSIPTGWSSMGCVTDSASARTLRYTVDVVGGATNMTVGNCISACQSHGWSIAGVEYSQECWCSSLLEHGGSCASDKTSCNMHCTGNNAEFCGGSNRLNVYQFSASPAASCPATVTSTLSSTTSSLPGTTTKAPTITTVATTTSPGISISSATTTIASSTCLPTISSGLFNNGDFEQIGIPFMISNTAGQNSIYIDNRGKAISGCSTLVLWAQGAQGTTTQLLLAQWINGLVPGQTYLFSMHQGWPFSTSSTHLPYFAVSLVNYSKNITEGYACGAGSGQTPCEEVGGFGSPWHRFSGSFVPQSSSVQLVITVTWFDSVNPYTLFLDGISVVKAGS